MISTINGIQNPLLRSVLKTYFIVCEQIIDNDLSSINNLVFKSILNLKTLNHEKLINLNVMLVY